MIENLYERDKNKFYTILKMFLDRFASRQLYKVSIVENVPNNVILFHICTVYIL